MKKKHINIFVIIAIIFTGLFAIAFINKFQGSSGSAFTQDEQLAPNYVVYSEANFEKAKENGRTVLFFWAPWCSTCSVLDDELMESSSELPSDVTILKINFDERKDLNKKYFVTQQHTLVQLDRENNEVTRWVGGGIEVLKQQIKEV